MGAQASELAPLADHLHALPFEMAPKRAAMKVAMKAAAPPMKAMKKAAMKAAGAKLTKSALNSALAEKLAVKPALANKMLGELVAVATAEVKKNGIFTLPGLCRIKTREACHEGRQEG